MKELTLIQDMVKIFMTKVLYIDEVFFKTISLISLNTVFSL